MGGFTGGVYARYHNWNADRLAGLNITDTRMDEEDTGFAQALSMCILKDGTQTVTADIPMGAHRITGLAAGMLADHALNMGQADVRYARADTAANITGALTVTSASANALSVGANGGTNPAFSVNAATANQATGIAILGVAAGGGSHIWTTSPAANENLFIQSKGTGMMMLTCNGGLNIVSNVGVSGPAVDGDQGANAKYSYLVQNKTTNANSDDYLASIGFVCAGLYGVKLSLRGDGVFGLGGWSTAAWRWYITLNNGDTNQVGVATAGGFSTSGNIACGTLNVVHLGASGNISASGQITATNGIVCNGDILAGGRLRTTGNECEIYGGAPTLMLHRAAVGSRIMFMESDAGIAINNVGNGVQTLYHTNSGNLAINGTYTAGSDDSMKKDVEPIGKALDLVRRLRGFRFTFKDTEERSAGVSAQELQAIAPELVGELNGRLTVAYGNFTAYLLEALKQLADEVDALKATRA